MNMNLDKLWKTMKEEEPAVLRAMGLQRVGHDLAHEQ